MTTIWSLQGLFTRQLVLTTAGGEAPALTTITASVTSHTKGAWTEVVATSDYDFDVGMLLLRFGNVNALSTNTAMLLDIGIGAAGSEVVLAANLIVGHAPVVGADNVQDSLYIIPLYVPAATRIACRIQAAVSSDTIDVNLELLGGPEANSHPLVFHGAETVGVDTATSSGATNLSDAAYVQLIAATAFPFRSAILMVGSVAASLFNEHGILTLAIGAAASEQDLFTGTRFVTSSNEYIQRIHATWHPIMATGEVPAGTRVAMKADMDSASAAKQGAAILLR